MSGNNPFAWAGLLKWSLGFTSDKPSSNNTNNEAQEPPTPMSEEDKQFLETVMKEGLVDETTRIREILTSFIAFLEKNNNDGVKDVEEEEEMIDSLWELRDLIGLIDYSKVFVTMGGLPFLLGCIQQGSNNDENNSVCIVSTEIRSVCLVLLATTAQNNPSVQSVLLTQPPDNSENSSSSVVEILLKLFFKEEDDNLKGRIIQALSCIIRGHPEAEKQICSNPDFISMMNAGLGVTNSSTTTQSQSQLPAENIRKRCIFLLQALLCSDDITSFHTIQQFKPSIEQIIRVYCNIEHEASLEIREMSLNFMITLLDQNINTLAIFENKEMLTVMANERISNIRNLVDEEEKERASVELSYWEQILQKLALLNESSRGVRAPASFEQTTNNSSSGDDVNAAPLLLTGRPADDFETLPQ